MKKFISLILTSLLALSALSAQDSGTYAVKVSAPNGAPALSLATLAAKNPENYTFVAAETISAEFANNNADFIIAPINAGAKLYKMGKSTYKLAAVVTWGNLYFASQKKNFKLKDIKKAELTLFGENTINSSIALAALEKNKIKPKSVNYLAGAANTQALLLSDADSIVLTAEPALTAAKMKNQNITAYPLNALYKKATGFDGFAQAGLFVRAETVEKNPQIVEDFLVRAEESCKKCSANLPEVVSAAVELKILPNAKIAETAIPNCAIRFMSAKEAKSQVETAANIDIKQYGGALPADDFYFGK
ncbi:MAG: ABC transporter substrate-binding protein [Treponema sp.]|uniref:ABC transporter substrate-binding protein n=1 Tax=Treponema sp. TaxID=166 RepID=UPI0025D38ACC|nr:ABC transporter substrate-binding protein [Treponema sp.]MBQ8678243.1 ABC transporter substrate-binding protein [Treponema sp.]